MFVIHFVTFHPPRIWLLKNDKCALLFNIYLSRDYRDSPAVYKGVDGETTVVDRVMLCSDTNDKLTIKCIIRHTRRPEVGLFGKFP